MSFNRRQTALGLIAAAGATTLPASQALATQIEMPDEDGPHTNLDTTQDSNDHMLAPVGINGQGPFNFLLDTGANSSVVSHKLAQRLMLTAGPPAMVHTSSASASGPAWCWTR
jgi:predicted aspartyl protease